MVVDSGLTNLEKEALRRAISKIAVEAWREGLWKQVVRLRVKARTAKNVGYYVDFEVPPSLKIADLPGDFNKNPPEAEANHPDGANGIFFIVYVKDGMLSFMEATSTADWPENEDQITFCD